MASSIPGAVAYFLTLAAGALNASSPDPPALVYFGKPLAIYTAPLTLQVQGAAGAQEPAELGPDYRREETYKIGCMLSSFAGDQDFPARMTEVFAAFELITVAVANDPTLGGNVRFAQCTDLDFAPDANAGGFSLGELAFAVDCQQRITSLT